MREERRKYEDKFKEMEQQLFEQQEELVKKDMTIKNLTQKQLDMHEAMKEAQKLQEAHLDQKRQLEKALQELAHVQQLRQSLQEDLLSSN